MAGHRRETTQLRGITFTFTISTVSDATYSVVVIEEQPLERTQEFDLPLTVDRASYALGWCHRHLRDVIHLL